MCPFRFGLSLGSRRTGAEWREAARKAEDLGYDVLLTADHIDVRGGSPFVPLAVAAAVTSRIRLGTLVLNNDFHHPLLLAREVSALDQLSDGRVELGLGAGYAREEYEAAGLPFDRGATRVERLEESVAVLDAALRGGPVEHRGTHHQVVTEAVVPEPVQQPRPPLLVAGHGRRVLSLAARRADAVGLSGLAAHDGWIAVRGFSTEQVAERVAYLRAEAGERFGEVELNALVQHVVVTDDPEAEAAAFADRARAGVAPRDLLDSPFVLLGSVESIGEQLQRHREQLGLTYFVVFEAAMEDFAGVVDRLAGT